MNNTHKGIIKSYHRATHTASVQITGSLSLWLDALPVSHAIHPEQMIVGRGCAVLYLDANNPADALVIAVLDANPNFPAWEHIETLTLAAPAAAITFNNLSTDFNAYRLLAFIQRSVLGGPLSTGLRFNNDAGPNYDFVDLAGNGAAATSGSMLGNTYGVVGVYDQTNYGIAFCYIQNLYAASTKEWLAFGGLGASSIRNISGRWNNTTDKITRIDIAAVIGNLFAGTKAILEGTRR